MRFINLVLLAGFLVLFSQCNKKNESANSTLKNGKWVAITQLNDEWVLFKPCDADNSTIELNDQTLTINWGQSTEKVPVESITQIGEGKYEITNKIDSTYTEKGKYTMQTLPNGTVLWWLLSGDTTSHVYVTEASAKNYKTLEQPCIECWSSEECAQMASGTDLSKLIGTYVLEKSNDKQILTVESVNGIEITFLINNVSKTECEGELKGSATVESNKAVYHVDGCMFDLAISDNQIEITNEMCEAQNPKCKFAGKYVKKDLR